MNNHKISTASSLYAKSQGSINSGTYQCHWCGDDCKSTLQHDDIISREIGVPYSRYGAKRPASPYVCTGCWLWQRKRITIHYYHPEPTTSGLLANIGATFALKDSQAPRNHSWLITETGAWVITVNTGPELHKILLNPPLKFVLMLLDGPNQTNHLHKAILNNLTEINADTKLHFTVNNVPHTYSVYELEQGMKYGPAYKEPGIQILFKLLKFPIQNPPIDENDVLNEQEPKKNPVGRPVLQRVADFKKTINKSQVEA